MDRQELIRQLREVADDATELELRLTEAEEIIADCRRYLTEFGSVEPSNVLQRIRQWQNDIAIARARNMERVQ